MRGKLLGKTIFVSLIALIAVACGTKHQIAQPVSQIQAEKTVMILAVNDMHAAIDNFPRLGFMVDSLRERYPDMLLLSIGDNQTGNAINDQHPEKGLPMIELMNALEFDLSAVGNHEFDSKPEGFSNLLKKANFNFICSNIYGFNQDKFPILPYKVITMRNGIRIALASVLDINERGIPDTHPDNVIGFAFADPVEKAHEMLHLRDSGDVLIYMNHYGFENDVELANELPAGIVDLIIGGHSHTKIDTEQIHNGILITQAERRLKYATLIELTIGTDKKVSKTMKLLTVGNKGSERADIRAMVDEYNKNPEMHVQIAEAQDDFESFEQVGYLMVDALRASSGTDISLLNPGGVRSNQLAKGAVTVLDVYSMDPFGNEMVLFNLSGKELKTLLTYAYKFDEYKPIFPSGIKTKYYLDSDGEVKYVEIFNTKGEPLDLDKTYIVSMNNYMATVYDYEHEDPGTGLFRPTAESMIDYLKELKYIPSYKYESRVELINE